MTRPGGPAAARARFGGAVALLAGYLLTVLALGRTLGGITIGVPAVGALACSAGCIAAWLARRSDARTTLPSATATALLAVVVCLSVDVLFAAYRNTAPLDPLPSDDARFEDAVTWIGEVYPPLWWHPAGVRFAKPGYRFAAAHYGDAYAPALMASPTLREHVFELKHVRMRIDDHGFRATGPPERARIFTLGDSFTFGWAVNDDETWSARLARRLGEPVYNLGVHDSSPVEELARLRLLLDTEPARFRPRHVVWMLFEGNDLEDARAVVPAPPSKERTTPSRFTGTVVDHLLQIPWIVQRQSVADLVLRGDLGWRRRDVAADPHVVDGVRSPHPVVRSRVHGPLLWLDEQLVRARASRRYVVEHPNFPRLRDAFGEMAALARAHGFTVTVVLAPSAVRVTAPFVNDLDPPLSPPFLLEALAEHAGAAGFDVVSLLEPLIHATATDLMYFKDDDHWTPAGHAVVADELARQLATRAR